ncbi:hypothetical protein UVI_02049420 [Ustilaginoidea virens]|uniref:Peptidase M20 dimerisation domain-containing protein n=1 Tax=Ustilaginoidea virens TaxID=1159556 RepID=A0A063BYL0_USTVR|nr:hypothetical protein UVI_02049420 [Ustilaginoidea virens]
MRPSSAVPVACCLIQWALCYQDQNPLLGADAGKLVSSHGHDYPPSYRNELLRLHKDLISIPSITGDENNVGRFIVGYLTKSGYNAQLQSVAEEGSPKGKERFNILAWKGGETPSPRVVVSTHIDVVPPHIPYSIEHGEITGATMIKGRGSVDAKGSLASMITAVNQLHHANSITTPEDVLLLLVVGEEVAGDGMRIFSKSLAEMKNPLRPEAVIFGEPTENRLACGHKGGLFCDVVAKGAPGHSGYPWLGKSANELMVRAMAKILDTDLGSSELFGDTTFNIGRFDGGVAANVIPETAKVKFAARIATGPEESAHLVVKEKVQSILDEVDKQAFEMICTHGYGSVKCNCEVEGETPFP